MAEIIELKDAPYTPSNSAKSETQKKMELAHDRIVKTSKERIPCLTMAVPDLPWVKANPWRQWIDSDTDLDFATWKRDNGL